MAASTASREISPFSALSDAVDHTRRKLFPFSFGGWITLAFVSLLESCPSGGGGGGGKLDLQDKYPLGTLSDDPIALIQMFFGWVAEHIAVVVAAVLLIMVLSVVVVWIRSRAVFVYMDDVVTGRFELVRPWQRNGEHADSYFLLCLVIQGAAFILVVLALGLSILGLIWASNHEFALGVVLLGAIPLFFITFAAILFGIFVSMALRDFVAPLQVIRNLPAFEAGRLFLDMFFARPWAWLGYAIVKAVVWICVQIVIFILSCLTCCIGALPLINEFFFQPIYFTERAWSLRFLSQFGEDIFGALEPPSPPPAAMEFHTRPDDAPTAPIDLSQIDFDKTWPDEPPKAD